MIAFSLIWFAIPLAIFGAIALRMTVAAFLVMDPVPQPVLPHPPRPEPRPTPVPIAKEAPSGTAITARKESIQSRPNVGEAPSDADEEVDRPSGPMHVPPFKTAWALLVAVIVGTACMAAFARLVVLAVLTILQSKGVVTGTDFTQLFTIVEALLLPLGFFALARLLQEMLPTSFLHACLIVLLSIVVFVVVVLAVFGLLWAVTSFVTWCFSFYRL